MTNILDNIVIDTDFYKTTHKSLYRSGVTGIFSYAESRGGQYETVILFGLQAWIKKNLLKPVTTEQIDYAERIISAMGVPFDRTGWDIIVSEYGGFLPITIKAVKEGLKLPYKNAIVTVECTDARLWFLVGYIETALIRLWFPTTIASKAYAIRSNIDILYDRYADTSASADFAFLDFSSRGVESPDSSGIGSAAFLTSFSGTDTILGVVYAYEYYGGKVLGYSVSATEHSVMCSYGEENEAASFKRLVDITPNDSILSVVSDTWNIYRACEYWNSLVDDITAKNITLVIRPDSGEPNTVLPQMLEILSKGFKTTVNDKGLKVFKNMKILWGDGVDETNYMYILSLMPKYGYGVENLILGSGGGLMQNVNRDTMKFAFKASAIELEGKSGYWIPIRKSPITDPGKASKAGRLETIKLKDGSGYRTIEQSLARQFGEPLLELVYENGTLHRDQTLEEIRELVRA